MKAILAATKITNKDVVKTSTLLEKILRFRKFPKRPPIKTVKNIADGVNHILKYGTMHTDSIVTNDSKNAQFFPEFAQT